jgi:hypothetical protein
MSLKIENFIQNGSDYSRKGYTYLGKSGIIFKKKQPPSSYIYTQGDLDGENHGIIDCGFMTEKSFQIYGNRSGVTQVNIVVQGKCHKLMPWSVNLQKTYTTAGIFTDFFNFPERVNYIRVGLQYTGGAPTSNDWVYVAFNFSS